MNTFLRRTLLVDAATCAGMGVLLAATAEAAAPLLGLPVALLEFAGLGLLPIAAFMAWVGTRASLPRAGVWLVIAGNVLWIAASVLLLVSGWVAPTVLGYAFVIAQAAAVVLLAELEYVGLRRLQV